MGRCKFCISGIAGSPLALRVNDIGSRWSEMTYCLCGSAPIFFSVISGVEWRHIPVCNAMATLLLLQIQVD